jgi:hypothetical protein
MVSDRFWNTVTASHFSNEAIIFAVISQANVFINPVQLYTVVEDVTLNHPAFEFLSNVPVS